MYRLEVHARGAVYSADSNTLLFRASEGSAVAIFASDSGECGISGGVTRRSQLYVLQYGRVGPLLQRRSMARDGMLIQLSHSSSYCCSS